MKKCPRCKKLKPTTNFSKNCSSPDGFRSICKACKKPYAKQYYKEHKEEIDLSHKIYRSRNIDKISLMGKLYYRKNIDKISLQAKERREKYKQEYILYGKQYYQANKDKVLATIRAYRKSNPEKALAHLILNRNISSSNDRPTVCSKCDAAGMVDGHHSDYSKPLDVIWLCRSCHMRLHSEIRKYK